MATHGDAIEISACEAGAFYAIQSLRQLVKENGALLPRFEIDDEPEFAYRGLYQDISRGRVPTLEKLKSIADVISYFKINSLQLYVEDAFAFREFDGIVTQMEKMQNLDFDKDENVDKLVEVVMPLQQISERMDRSSVDNITDKQTRRLEEINNRLVTVATALGLLEDDE